MGYAIKLSPAMIAIVAVTIYVPTFQTPSATRDAPVINASVQMEVGIDTVKGGNGVHIQISAHFERKKEVLGWESACDSSPRLFVSLLVGA